MAKQVKSETAENGDCPHLLDALAELKKAFAGELTGEPDEVLADALGRADWTDWTDLEWGRNRNASHPTGLLPTTTDFAMGVLPEGGLGRADRADQSDLEYERTSDEQTSA